MFDKVMKNKPNCSTGALSYCAYRYIFGDDFILQKIGFTASIYDYFLYGSLPYLNVDKYNLIILLMTGLLCLIIILLMKYIL